MENNKAESMTHFVVENNKLVFTGLPEQSFRFKISVENSVVEKSVENSGGEHVLFIVWIEDKSSKKQWQRCFTGEEFAKLKLVEDMFCLIPKDFITKTSFKRQVEFILKTFI